MSVFTASVAEDDEWLRAISRALESLQEVDAAGFKVAMPWKRVPVTGLDDSELFGESDKNKAEKDPMVLTAGQTYVTEDFARRWLPVVRAAIGNLTDNSSTALRVSNHKHRRVVGITGPPGAGKTVFAGVLAVLVDAVLDLEKEKEGREDSDSVQRCIVLGMDAYHRTNEWLDTHCLRQLKGSPLTFDVSAFERDLNAVRFQSSLLLPVYDRKIHDPVPDSLEVSAVHELVIVEGLYLALTHDEVQSVDAFSTAPDKATDSVERSMRSYDSLRPHFDCLLFIEAPLEQCQQAVTNRKTATGRSLKEAERHWEHSDRINWTRIMKSKSRADFVVTFDANDRAPVSCLAQL